MKKRFFMRYPPQVHIYFHWENQPFSEEKEGNITLRTNETGLLSTLTWLFQLFFLLLIDVFQLDFLFFQFGDEARFPEFQVVNTGMHFRDFILCLFLFSDLLLAQYFISISTIQK